MSTREKAEKHEEAQAPKHEEAPLPEHEEAPAPKPEEAPAPKPEAPAPKPEAPALKPYRPPQFVLVRRGDLFCLEAKGEIALRALPPLCGLDNLQIVPLTAPRTMGLWRNGEVWRGIESRAASLAAAANEFIAGQYTQTRTTMKEQTTMMKEQTTMQARALTDVDDDNGEPKSGAPKSSAPKSAETKSEPAEPKSEPAESEPVTIESLRRQLAMASKALQAAEEAAAHRQRVRETWRALSGMIEALMRPENEGLFSALLAGRKLAPASPAAQKPAAQKKRRKNAWGRVVRASVAAKKRSGEPK